MPNSKGNTLLWATLLGVILLRLPSVLLPRELNVDESQMLSQGMKYLLDPVPWRAVDGNSGGPLDSYVISILLLVGFKPGYILAHSLAAVLTCLQVWMAYLTLSRLRLGRYAALGSIPLALFFGFATSSHYTHYSSELIPCLFLQLGFYSFLRWLDAPSPGWIFLSGLAIGCAPWGKLQSGPVGLALGLVVLAAIVSAAGLGPAFQSPRVKHALLFCLAAVVPAAVLLGMVAAAGVTTDFWSSYIVANVSYAGSESWLYTLKDGGRVLIWPQVLPLTVIDALAVGLFLLNWSPAVHESTVKDRWAFVGLFVYMSAALVAVAHPVTFFGHYFVFLAYPMTCFAAAIAHRALATTQLSFLRQAQLVPAAVILTACVIASYEWSGL
jgi:hypothetical protein